MYLEKGPIALPAGRSGRRYRAGARCPPRVKVGVHEVELKLSKLWAYQSLRSFGRRTGDGSENPDIAIVPIATQKTESCQIVVTEPFSAKVSDGHTAAKMEEGIIRADRHSTGVQVAKFRQQFGW
jgi:hypothetical protein